MHQARLASRNDTALKATQYLSACVLVHPSGHTRDHSPAIDARPTRHAAPRTPYMAGRVAGMDPLFPICRCMCRCISCRILIPVFMITAHPQDKRGIHGVLAERQTT